MNLRTKYTCVTKEILLTFLLTNSDIRQVLIKVALPLFVGCKMVAPGAGGLLLVIIMMVISAKVDTTSADKVYNN